MILRFAILLAPPILAAADAPAPFADISGVIIESYDVTGRSAAAIRKSIDAARPTDPNDGKRVDGLSSWNIRWRWRRDAGGTCATTPDDVVFTATVKVPRLAGDGVSAKVRERFDRYLQSLLKHEEGHVRYAWEHRGEIVTAINGATCATAGAAAQAAVKTIAAHDLAYDKATRHGADTILPFP